jgi:hypothetical protein
MAGIVEGAWRWAPGPTKVMQAVSQARGSVIFEEEAVAALTGVDVRVGLDRAESFTDLAGFDGFAATESEAVLFAEDGDGVEGEFGGAAMLKLLARILGTVGAGGFVGYWGWFLVIFMVVFDT